MQQQLSYLAHPRGYRMDYLTTVPDQIRDSTLHVFLHGFSRIESQLPPVFYRRRWASGLGAPCLFLSDPIHRLTRESACGWYLLGEEDFTRQVLALRDSIVARLGLAGTVWHGPSSGGYAAIKLLLASPTPDLAFAVAPHNDPTLTVQWHEEAEPFRGLPGMAAPLPLTELDALTDRVPGSHLYIAISEGDAYFARKHLKPIMMAVGHRDDVQAVVLRNGLGHGALSDADYRARLDAAMTAWRAKRSTGPDRVVTSLG